MKTFRTYLEDVEPLKALEGKLITQYPGLKLFMWESEDRIEVKEIVVPKELRGRGIGSAVMQAIKDYARSVKKPVTLSPSPSPGKKAALDRFYKKHGFVVNKGRNVDYRLSSPFSKTMYWKEDVQLEAQRSEFQVLKDSRKSLPEAERAKAIKAGATWSSSGDTPTSAIWMGTDSHGKEWYCSNTHRAYAKSETLQQAIKRFHDYVEPSS